MTKARRSWSDDDLAAMIRMREVERCRWSDIDRAFGRTPGSCCAKYESLRREKLPTHPSDAGGRIEVTCQQQANRIARKQAEAQRDLTAAVFGDPPPGYSALDQKPGAS